MPSLSEHRPAATGGHARRGFTLLELLVVIFIMMLMTTLAVASFHGFLDTERIRLAGGTVDSAFRLARQYAMSKRCKVMVELVDPMATSVVAPKTLSPLTCYADFDNPAVCQAGSLRVKSGKAVSYAKFDLSSLAGKSVMQATLQFVAATYEVGKPLTVAVKEVGDAWVTTGVDQLRWNNKDSYPPAATTLDTLTVDTIPGSYSVDVSTYVAAQAQGDGFASFYFSSSEANRALNFSISLDITYEAQVVPPEGYEDTMLRSVRIISCLRTLKEATGGIEWVLDKDSNALKTMDLPKNIHFVLKPAKTTISQYSETADDNRFPTRKICFVFDPDGSCSAAAPDVEDDPAGAKDHWSQSQYTNLVILHDANNDDLCLLYVPPATSFTRQRYLAGGAETDAFVDAHAPFALW